MKRVVFFSPAFPAEMPYFARGLAQVGAQVIGIGDQPVPALPEVTRHALTDYIQVRNLFDEEAVLDTVARYASRIRVDQVECLWEPGMLLAARLRERLGLPGMTVEETIPFRDKSVMKQKLDAAGVRTPRHRRATNEEEIRAAVAEIGLPVCIKPIAGAGSADTYQVATEERLDEVVILTRHVRELSVEEWIDGEEYTFDTICSNGTIHYHNVSWYRPRPLVQRTEEWVSPQTVVLPDHSAPEIQAGVEMGRKVHEALGFRTGFTHMEWFLKPDGEAVFGEIGARPPGARSVDIMNYACDIDVFVGWAEAAVHGSFSQKVERKYSAAVIFKRAQGQGRIRRVEGLERLKRDLGDQLCHVDLLPIGAHRRNWKATLVSDGYLILRTPSVEATAHLADRVAQELQIFAA